MGTTAGGNQDLARFMAGLVKRNPGETEFTQAVQEVAETVLPFQLAHPEYAKAQILQRMTEPDRIVSFRVTWQDDQGNIRANRAWRVQFNNSIGPYKGGLRFHASVNQSILKFLGFEQTFKNALTTLPMGGAKGGANFNPKGKSDDEVMRFCQSMMIELQRHIGEDTDVPAGDIGVGAREISFLFGQYKRLANRFAGVMTGKGLSFGGSHVRTEATGYGCIYFTQNMLARLNESLEGKTCVVSGAGNVALYTVEKLLHLGAKPVTMSDSSGTIFDKNGIDEEKLAYLKHLKLVTRGRMSEYAEKYDCEYLAKKAPWCVPCDAAFPSATQNELDVDDARELLKNGCKVVAEGANMPCTRDATNAFLDAKIAYAPGKASNAGGVSVSGLEQSQNSVRASWSREEVEAKLERIMSKIHDQCVEMGEDDEGHVDYVRGANLAAFKKVGGAMLAYGAV